MQRGLRRAPALCVLLLAGLPVGAGCSLEPTAPAHPTWANVAPILRGECVSCHGWTATDRPANAAGVHPENTGGSLRFDFFDLAPCGDAAQALDANVSLAGSPIVTAQLGTDVLPQNGASWPRMPPQPSLALPDWELETIERWAPQPAKGPPPPGNRPPTIAVDQFPAVVDATLTFTAVIDDPDGDSVLGVIEVGGLAFLMDRPGSFAVSLDSTSWPSGPMRPIAVLCDGWVSQSYDLGPVQIQH
jgi:hypothetical protein